MRVTQSYLLQHHFLQLETAERLVFLGLLGCEWELEEKCQGRRHTEIQRNILRGTCMTVYHVFNVATSRNVKITVKKIRFWHI